MPPEKAAQVADRSLVERPTKSLKPEGPVAKVEMPLETALFATLEHSHFHSRRRYKQLDPKRREIRLLKIHPQRLRVQDLETLFPGWIKQDNTNAA
jgi:hypothetical protein